jgi:pimeloyl-ACP methyl ester carboxylesterase
MDPGGRFLLTPDGARLYHQLLGQEAPGTAAVLCDGLGCDGFIWKYLLPQLSATHPVLQWHYRGHGRSPAPPDLNQLGVSYNCEDLDALISEEGLSEAILFGYSMGVQVALEYHRRHPAKVRGLVLMCGSYGNPLDTFHDSTALRSVFPWLRDLERFPKAASRMVRLGVLSEALLEYAVRFEVNPQLIHREDLAPYFHHLATMSPVVFMRTLDSLSRHTAWDHLPEVQVPTLVVGGERDSFTPPWLSTKMADAIPGAELLIVPGGSHTAPLEQPAAVNARVLRFLADRVDSIAAQ